MNIVPKNWAEFQHYKNRRPPWIKLYRSLLDDAEFHCLPDASKALAIMLWLLASDSETGVINGDIKALAFRLRTTPQKMKDALNPLIESGFFHASEVLAPCLQHAIPEKSREETETDAVKFKAFWNAYPRKKAKADAEKAWKAARINGDFDAVMAALDVHKKSTDWLKDDGKWVPYPASWINGKRWEDEISSSNSSDEDLL